MKPKPIAIALSIVTALNAIAFSRDGGAQSRSELSKHVSTRHSHLPAPGAGGEKNSDIGDRYLYVFQDKDNNYWFGTDGNGVCRYDGKTLTRFTTKDGLPSDQVGGLQQHKPTGDIILSTSNGFSRFDGRAFTTLSAADASKSEWKLQPDDLWFPAGQDTGAVYRYDGKVLHRLTFPKTKAGDAATLPRDEYPNAKYSPYDVYIIFRDSRGHVWFGTAVLGACRYDGTSFAWFAKPALELGSFGTRSIIEDKDGKFWFSSTLNRYAIDAAPAPLNEQGDLAIKYHMEPGVGEDKDPFSAFMSATRDKNGDLWVATLGAGVFRYDGSRMIQYPVAREEGAMFGISIYKDRQDNLWLCSQKDGVYKFNGEKFERFKPRVDGTAERDPYFTPTGAKTTPFMPKVIIRNIREDRAGNIWFATFGGPIRYDGKEFTNYAEEVGLAKTRVFSLLEDRRGALWFASITGGASSYDGQSFRKFTEKEGLAGNDIHWMFEDRDAQIWFGTTKGASRYDGRSFTNFTTNDGLIDNSVYVIGQDAAGRIWFGTQGGICSYDGKSFSNFAHQVGRTFANIRAMAVDKSGNLWFGGQGGAYRYDGKTLTTFTSNDGLLADFVGSMIVDRAGNVWLGHPGHADQAGGASRYDGKSFKHFTEKDGLNGGNVYAMGEDKAGNIWFGSVDAGACRYDGKTFTNFSATDTEKKVGAQPEE